MSFNSKQKGKQKIPELRFRGFAGAWEQKELGEAGTFLKGDGISKDDITADGDNQCIRYGELYTEYSEIIRQVKSKTNFPKEESLLSKENDVLLPSNGETALDIAKASCITIKNILLGGGINVLRPNKDVNGEFLAYYLSNFQNRNIARIAQGNSVVHLYSSHLKILKINLPTFTEQKKVAEFLESVDGRIGNLKAEKAAWEKYKKGMMQKIFSQEIRFKDENGKDFPEWEEGNLKDYLIYSSVRNSDKKFELVLSVNNTKGFIAQSEQFEDHRVASKDVSNYKIVMKNDFAYNPSRINIGSIARLINFDSGIVSPMYTVFKLSQKLNQQFFENYIKTHRFKYLVRSACSGSVRDTLNYEDLIQFKVNLPNLKEQGVISNFLTSIENLIETKQQQITQAEQWKKGLMQKMFI